MGIIRKIRNQGTFLRTSVKENLLLHQK